MEHHPLQQMPGAVAAHRVLGGANPHHAQPHPTTNSPRMTNNSGQEVTATTARPSAHEGVTAGHINPHITTTNMGQEVIAEPEVLGEAISKHVPGTRQHGEYKGENEAGSRANPHMTTTNMGQEVVAEPEGLGHAIAKHIPGTRQHKEYKDEKGAA